jgi:hypothetical protein
MSTKLKAIPFIFTARKNSVFFSQPFRPEMLGNLMGRKPLNVRGFAESNENFDERMSEWNEKEKNVLFEGWVGKERINWIEFKNDNGDKIEFYATTYKINGIEHIFPEYLDLFISDCYRLKTPLYFKDEVTKKFQEIYHLVEPSNAKKYIDELLCKINKND